MSSTPFELFQNEKLDEAVEAALSLVKKSPTDTTLRYQLAELSCIAGDLERADRQWDTVSNQDPKSALRVAMMRQFVRAETSRRECFDAGRVPEFLGLPSPEVEAHLRALSSLREGDSAAAASFINQKDDVPPVSWVVNGEEVAVLRDLDDILSPVLEVHTTTGKYYWVAWTQILSLELHKPERPIDLLWRQATLSIEDGPDGDVYLPVIYSTSSQEAGDDGFRLGHKTDWINVGSDVYQGRGQKTLLADDTEIPLMELESVERKGA